MTVIIGAALAANALLVALALSVGGQLFVNQLAGTVFGPASRVFYDQLLTYLERGQQVLLWLALILVVVGWFAGRTRTGAAARATVAGGLEHVGSALAGGPVAGAGRWVAANALVAAGRRRRPRRRRAAVGQRAVPVEAGLVGRARRCAALSPPVPHRCGRVEPRSASTRAGRRKDALGADGRCMIVGFCRAPQVRLAPGAS